MSVRRIFVVVSVGALVVIGALASLSPKALWALAVVLPVSAVGWVDMLQRSQAIRRNYPVIGNIRYLFESFRPELQQYFVESNSSGRPFNREQRSLVYRRAKNVVDTLPFGTERDVYAPGYEWMNPSLLAKHPPATPPRIRVGGPACTKPYDAAVMNISAMSFGSLSTAAIRALNQGAKLGGFARLHASSRARGFSTRPAAYVTARPMSVPPPSCTFISTSTGSVTRSVRSTTSVSKMQRWVLVDGRPQRQAAVTAAWMTDESMLPLSSTSRMICHRSSCRRVRETKSGVRMKRRVARAS